MQKYSIGDKFELVEEISTEPIGNYYRAINIRGEEKLILLLNSSLSNLTRDKLEYINIEKSHTNLRINTDQSLYPTEEVIDFLEGIVIVMPYFEGEPLSEYIHKTNIKSISEIKKLMITLLVALSDLHQSEKYHGFINFSTTWVTNNNQVVVLGYKIFSTLFDGLSYHGTDLENNRISTCFNLDEIQTRLKCSIFSDYYSTLVIIASILHGRIVSPDQIDSNTINKKISKQTSIYLTKTFCKKSYDEFISIRDWVDRIKDKETVITNRRSILASFIGGLIIIALFLTRTFNFNSNENIDSEFNHKLIVKSKISRDIDDFNLDNLDVAISELADPENDIYNEVDKLLNTNKLNSIDNTNEQDTSIRDELVNKLDASEIKAEQDFENNKSTTTDKGLGKAMNNKNIHVNNIKFKPEFICHTQGCYEILQNGKSSPIFTKLKNNENDVYVMQKPILRNDYYLYCLSNNNCIRPTKFSIKLISTCLMNSNCAPDLKKWLQQPNYFTSIQSIDDYIRWLNKEGSNGYKYITDSIWTRMIKNVWATNKCRYSLNNDFYLFSEKPELVIINSKFALREPVEFFEKTEQCRYKLSLISDNINQNAQVMARLIKS